MKDEEPGYLIEIEGRDRGPFSFNQLNSLWASEKIDFACVLRDEEGEPAGTFGDLLSGDRLKSMRSAGVEFVQVLGSGNGDDCSHCLALQNSKYRIEKAPVLPVKDCSCRNGCLCVLIAVAG